MGIQYTDANDFVLNEVFASLQVRRAFKFVLYVIVLPDLSVCALFLGVASS